MGRKKVYEFFIVFTLSLIFFLIFKLPNNPIGSADELSYVYLTEKIAKSQTLFLENNLQINKHYLTPRIFVVTLNNDIIPFNQLGAPFIFSFFYYLFGKFSYFIINPVLGALGIAVIYLFALEYYNKKIAVWSAIILALNPIYWIFSETMYTEILSTTLIILGFYLLVKYSQNRNILFVVFSSLLLSYSILVRYTNIVALLVVFLLILMNKSKRFNLNLNKPSLLFIIYSFSTIFAILIILYINSTFYGNALSTGYNLYQGGEINSFQSAFSLSNLIRNSPIYILGLIIELPILSFFIAKYFVSIRNNADLLYYISLFLLTGFFVIYSSYIASMYQIWHMVRYLISAFPFLVVVGVSELFRTVKKNNSQRFLLWLIVLSSLFIGFIQLTTFTYSADRSAQIGYKIRDLTEPDAVIISSIYDKSIIPTIYANRTLYNPGTGSYFNKTDLYASIKYIRGNDIPVYLLVDEGYGGITNIRTSPKKNYYGDGWNVRYITSAIRDELINSGDFSLSKSNFQIHIRPLYPIQYFQITEEYSIYSITPTLD